MALSYGLWIRKTAVTGMYTKNIESEEECGTFNEMKKRFYEQALDCVSWYASGIM